MKNYQKAEMIAKNLPTGSYAAGCPVDHKYSSSGISKDGGCWPAPQYCYMCELAG